MFLFVYGPGNKGQLSEKYKKIEFYKTTKTNNDSTYF